MLSSLSSSNSAVRVQDFGGRGAAVKGLCEAFLTGAPIHASLLTGPGGVGKRTLASLLAQSLFCTAAEKPCGECPPCRRYLTGSHPDAHHIPEKKSIGVDEIRALNTALAAAPYEGGYKTAVIDCAGNMTPQAQNSLLKTLEEPPPGTAFLLTATSAAQLLPTVRSRCRVVRVPPMEDEAVEAALVSRGIEQARASRLAALSGGSIGEALSMEADETFWPLWERVESAMKSAHASSDVWAALTALRDDKGASARVLDLMERAIEGALKARLVGTPAPDGPWGRELSNMDPRPLTGLLEGVARARRMLASNVPWQAALERFVLEYAEESKQWQS